MQDPFYEIKVEPSNFFDSILSFIIDLTGEAVEIDGGSVFIYTNNNPYILQTEIKKYCDNLATLFKTSIKCDIKITQKDNKDWIQEYQKNIQPVTIENIFIHPQWIEDKKDKINILINPELSFGTGDHSTTKLAIKAILQHAKENALDLGCGSGILGIILSKIGIKGIDLCDIDENAIKNAKKNLDLNCVKNYSLWQGSINQTKKRYNQT
jgi:ribosomal protein L11 methyltransferase